MSLDQLSQARREVVLALKRRGEATIADLAKDLGSSGEAVRQQLLQLGRTGLVFTERGTSGHEGGRPPAHYRLTPAGEALFPKAHGELAIRLIDAVQRELGDAALTRLLHRLSEERFAALGSVADRGLPEKLAALRSVYLNADPYAEVIEQGREVLFVERNCPFFEVAMQRPALCASTVDVLSRLFGCRVEREQSFQQGQGCCSFRIFLDQQRTAAEVAPAAR